MIQAPIRDNSPAMKILCIGDVMGAPGRKAVKAFLPGLIREHGIDLVIANGENAAHGFGITAETASALVAAGVDVITSGNHAFDKKEAIPLYEQWPQMLRPANLYPAVPGRGVAVVTAKNGERAAVINLMGRVYMPPCDDPFRCADDALAKLRDVAVKIVDMHCEVSSEKQGMGWHLAGRVTAVFGSHTHVPTADVRLLAGATAFVTDVGMTGPYDSIIGMEKAGALERFHTGLNARLEVAKNDVRFHALLVECDQNGKATGCERIEKKLDDVPAG
jgi:metallophosphoesterase (TIGR00282 family)